jgi:hypothetical protein
VLRIVFGTDAHPGVFLYEPIRDWSPYRTLVVTVFVPDSKPLRFDVSVRFFRKRAQNVHWPYNLAPGANTLRVPLDERFDPSRGVSTLVLYTNAGASGRTLYLGDIHLE